MHDFILPEDIRSMAQQVSDDITHAWSMLNELCGLKGIAISEAESQVRRYKNIVGLNELEAIHRVYQEIGFS